MNKYLKELCELNAVSGDEKAVRKYIINALKDVKCNIKTDNLGNLIIFKEGRKNPQKNVAFFAHMDEVGFIVKGINSNGFISLEAVGGVPDAVVFGRKISFKSGVAGVIGGKPTHHLKGDEKDVQPKLSELYADIGTNSKEETEQLISLGDYAYFASQFEEFGNGLIKSKAIDDRAGCAIMLALLLSDLEYSAHFVFTAQEEIGARGAKSAAYWLQPDYAIILEATTACDIAGIEDDKKVCNLNAGTVVPFMDKGTSYNRELFELAFHVAAENNLKCQTKTLVTGGNDGASVHKTASGIKTICLAVPCRYLHSPNCVASKSDIMEMRILAEKLMEKICSALMKN